MGLSPSQIVIIGAVYLFPTVVALFRKHPNYSMIVAVNLLAGWTIVCWIIAMAWASQEINRDRA